MTNTDTTDEMVARRLIMARSLWDRCEALRRKREVLTGEPCLGADIAVAMISKGLVIAEREIEEAEIAEVGGDLVETLDKATTSEAAPEPRGYWKKLPITDPRVPAVREALRAVWATTPDYVAGATPRVNQLQVSKDGLRCRGNVILAATRGRIRRGLAATTTPVETNMPGGPAPARLMDRFNQKLAAGLRKKP